MRVLLVAMPAMMAAHALAAAASSQPAASQPSSMAAGPSSSSQPATRKLLVLPMENRLGVSPRVAALVTDVVVAEARRVPGYAVMSKEDVEQVLKQEVRRQLLGCVDERCVTDLGRQLDADEVLYGSIGVLGAREMVVTLTRLDPNAQRVLGGRAERLSGASQEATLDAVPRMMVRLFDGYEPPPARTKAAMSLPLLVGVLTAMGAVVEYAAFASVMLSFSLPVANAVMFWLSAAAFLFSPVAGAFAMVYLMDALGRRVVGARYAAAVGVAALALSSPLVVLGSVVLATTFMLGGAATVLPSYLWVVSQEGISPGLVAAAATEASPRAGAGLFTGMLTSLLPAVIVVAVAVPLAQALVSAYFSKARPLDADVGTPGLWSNLEPVPSWAGWMPHQLAGGEPPVPERLQDEAPAPGPEPSGPSSLP